MATPQVKDLVLRSPAGSSDVITFAWPLQIGHGQDKHDNGIDIIDTIKFVCDELPSISSAFEEINLNQIDTACYKTMTNLVDRFNKAVDSIVALEKGTSLPAERLNKFAHPSLLRHILQLVYNAAVLDPDKLNQYEPFSPEVYGETSYELVQQMIKHVTPSSEDTFIDLGSGVGQVVLQMAGSFPLKTCIGIEKADTPARYAERMDTFFRQYMAWFGKRYCEYKLIKGDFLVDEHREKITSSTLVFVNNFAFGPTVDHQLKERFADLRDGARVVSSKSFCPLNFRITDRNLSDIGTIMHVSEIPPLKGSVSWTCKPVSYYLHVIDRTILERYFQRLKTKGGGDQDHVGTVRTTRDRAKREANIGHNNNNNNHNNHHNHSGGGNANSTLFQSRTQSPANVTGGAAATGGTLSNLAAASKTRQQAASAQQQRSLDMDTSTESDGEATNGGGTTTTTTTTTASNGPMTRKVYSDWCSSKGKSSQSDDEENNNTNTNAANQARNVRNAATQKKRKKLTRKAAIASKSAAAAQREAEREAASTNTPNNSKESSSKEDNGGTVAGGVRGGPGRKGRMKKGARGRKSLKIVGLDVLHKQTVLSTSLDVMTKKLPAAPGTVDQQLTSLLTGDMVHEELDIPTAPQDTPYALQILLDVFRAQYMAMIDHMKSNAYLPQVQKQIAQEQERKVRLKNRASQLDKQIKVLIDDSVALLKVRMNELGINVSSPNDLIAKAKEIVGRHKDLQYAVSKIRNEVTVYESEQKLLLSKQLKHLPEYQKLCSSASATTTSNGKVKLEVPQTLELSEASAQELVLREIANTLTQRKKLYAQVSSIEQETDGLQKTADERRTAAALMAQGTNITLANPSPTQPLQLTAQAATTTTSVTPNSVPNSNLKVVGSGSSSSSSSGSGKHSRRSRENRGRSQEWPEVPEMGKIEESNPEVLAQKILETGRQIEAGKFQGQPNQAHPSSYQQQHHQTMPPSQNSHINYSNGLVKGANSSSVVISPAESRPKTSTPMPGIQVYMDSTLMPAPKQQQQQPSPGPSVVPRVNLLPKCELPGLGGLGRGKHPLMGSGVGPQESPKVANFEDRLKSIITSALNEDQEQRSKAGVVVVPQLAHEQQTPPAPAPSPVQSPVSKRSKQTTPHHHLPPPPAPSAGGSQQQQQVPSNLHNIITVSTQGLMHLNANTTISPITPPLPLPSGGGGAAAAASAPPSAGGLPPHPANGNLPYASAYGSGGGSKYKTPSKYSSSSSSAKQTSPHAPPAPGPPPPPSNHLQHLSNPNHLSLYGVPPPPPHSQADLSAAGYHHHRRRGSVSTTSYEHFIVQHQQQQQQHALMMAAAAAAAQRQQQQQRDHQREQEQQLQQQVNQAHASHHHSLAVHPHHPAIPTSLEFKAPPENLMTAGPAQRAGSREQLDMVDLLPRSGSAQPQDYGYAPPTRERLLNHERSVSRESASISIAASNSLIRPPSRPSSNSSQPDYTQVSPAKMALRRHLSQEKLNQHPPQPTPPPQSINEVSGGGPRGAKTIGDLVNGEIERTLEISHQSIINAAVNMSTMGSGSASVVGVGSGASNNNSSSVHFMERAFLAERERERERSTNERMLINLNAQRPERVHVRPLTDDPQPTNYSQSAAGSSNNLATLAHVAYSQKTSAAESMVKGGQSLVQQPQQQPTSSSVSSSPSSRAGSSRGEQPPYQGRAVTAPRGREYQPVALPRAEMKGCIEAYFHEEQQQQQQQKTKAVGGSASGVRAPRQNGANPPLEGLAASLQDHVRARKYKEENEERQRRAAAAAVDLAHYSSNHAPPAHAHYQAALVGHPLNGTPHKVELGVKRTSPLAPHQQPRPSKMSHYEPPVLATAQHLHHPYANANGSLPPPAPLAGHPLHATSPSPTPSSSSSSGGGGGRRKLLVEPILMSPEINSIMGDERPLQLSTSGGSNSRPHSNSSHHVHPSLTPTALQQQQQQQPMLHNHHHLTSQQQPQHLHLQRPSTTPTSMVGGRGSAGAASAADDGKLNVYQDKSTVKAIAPPPPPPPHTNTPKKAPKKAPSSKKSYKTQTLRPLANDFRIRTRSQARRDLSVSSGGIDIGNSPTEEKTKIKSPALSKTL